MGYLTVLQVRLGVKIGDLHAKDFNAFRKRRLVLNLHQFSNVTKVMIPFRAASAKLT